MADLARFVERGTGRVNLSSIVWQMTLSGLSWQRPSTAESASHLTLSLLFPPLEPYLRPIGRDMGGALPGCRALIVTLEHPTLSGHTASECWMHSGGKALQTSGKEAWMLKIRKDHSEKSVKMTSQKQMGLLSSRGRLGGCSGRQMGFPTSLTGRGRTVLV